MTGLDQTSVATSKPGYSPHDPSKRFSAFFQLFCCKMPTARKAKLFLFWCPPRPIQPAVKALKSYPKVTSFQDFPAPKYCVNATTQTGTLLMNVPRVIPMDWATKSLRLKVPAPSRQNRGNTFWEKKYLTLRGFNIILNKF